MARRQFVCWNSQAAKKESRKDVLSSWLGGQAPFLEIGVASAEHCREFGDFHFAPFLFAGFFEVAVVARFSQCSFAVDSLF